MRVLLQQALYLDKLLAPRIASVEFNWSVALQLRNEVGTCSLSYSRRSSDENGTRSIHSMLSRFLEVRFEARRPAER